MISSLNCDVDDCGTQVLGLNDGYEMSRGLVCHDCIDYHDRHGHWPDESPEVCAECRIDDGAIRHECSELNFDLVREFDGPCPHCGDDVGGEDGE